ncbi:hypothetical protein KI387_027946, partial [Taxus chinensis]
LQVEVQRGKRQRDVGCESKKLKIKSWFRAMTLPTRNFCQKAISLNQIKTTTLKLKKTAFQWLSGLDIYVFCILMK